MLIILIKIESDKNNALLKFLNPIEIKSVTPTISPRESFNIHAVKPNPKGISIIDTISEKIGFKIPSTCDTPLYKTNVINKTFNGSFIYFFP